MLTLTQRNEIKNKIVSELRETKRDGIEDLIAYMEKYDYFTAPASTKFHSNCEGGLAYHSGCVTKLLRKKKKEFNLDITNDECTISGYLHDLCKMNMYEKGYKLRKENNKWVADESYVINEAFPIGHGEKSVIIAQQFIKLTPKEILMIMYHMGFSLPKEQYKNLNNAKELCKAIEAIHTADDEAATFLETIDAPKTIPIETYNKIMDAKPKEVICDYKLE